MTSSQSRSIQTSSWTLILLILISFFSTQCEKEDSDPPVSNPSDTISPIDTMSIDTMLVDTLNTDTIEEPNPEPEPPVWIDENPAAEGFNFIDSDSSAISLADSVMKAMGGRSAWDATRYLGWTFLGNDWVWDKLEGRLRYAKSNGQVVFYNLFTGDGQVYEDGVLNDNPTALENTLNSFYNDSYWLFMPFKLKDSGVTLVDLGEETQDGLDCYKLQLTFQDVGATPDNKYEVYINKASNLVSYWKFFNSADAASALISTPWQNYQQHGEILLSTDRGPFFGFLESASVYSEDIPQTTFTDPTDIDLSAYEL